MKLERFCLIFEESTYLVNSGRVMRNDIRHKEDDDEEFGGFYCRSNGKVH